LCYCCFAIGTLLNAMVISPFNYAALLCLSWTTDTTIFQGNKFSLQYFKFFNFQCALHSVCDSVSIIDSRWQRENHLPWNRPHMMKTLLLQRASFFQLQKSLHSEPLVCRIWDYPKL
jgi:hypothetical protein